MKLWKTIDETKKAIGGAAKIADGRLNITDEEGFRKLAEDLVHNAVFNTDTGVRDAARWIIWEASQSLGCPSGSIHNLYMARAEDLYRNTTVPAINIRGLTFDVAKTIFRTLQKQNAGACIFEIARSEIDYTAQRPAEYTAAVLGAAISEGYKGPVFLQGDHFQVKAKKWKEDSDEEVGAVKDLIGEAIAAGFYNIDIDTSTLVDLSQTTVTDQQKNNYEVSATLTKQIRENEPEGVTISVGGEIGEVGGKNSTAEELIAYLNGFNKALASSSTKSMTGPSKISIQTGTSHGGVPLPDGSIAEVKLDFGCLAELGEIGKKQFHIGGVVQHGASTLPQEAFDNFPKTQTLEVHLATGFQNSIYDSKNFPDDLKKEVYAWINNNLASERKSDQTDEQFYYKTRKKGFGPFKEKMWNLPVDTRNAIMEELAGVFDMLFSKLNITGSAELIKQHIEPKSVHWDKPADL